ncbi:hypothetical protein [Helicobacter sp. T3_23-1056]
MNTTQNPHKHIEKIKTNALAKAHIYTKKMIKNVVIFVFVALFATLNIALSQINDSELEREIQRLEKQKKILELKKQNKKLQKELDDDSSQTPQKAQNQTSKQNPQNQTPYYAPNQSQKPKRQVIYDEDEDDDENTYTSTKTEVQGFIRVDGGYHIGIYMLGVPQVNLELGLNINENARVFLGGSYAWGKYKQYDQYIANAYIGIGWIPILFDSPVRYVLDSYLGATFGRVYLQTGSSLEGYKTYRYSGSGFLAGLRTGIAFDIGSHAQLEIGTRIEASLGLLNLVVTPYGSFTFVF